MIAKENKRIMITLSKKMLEKLEALEKKYGSTKSEIIEELIKSEPSQINENGSYFYL